jgi:hypothetical protein
MNMKPLEDIRLDKTEQFFGEWVHYEDDEDKEEARKYLLAYMKYGLRKIKPLEYIQHQFIDRNNVRSQNMRGEEDLIPVSTLAIKFSAKAPNENQSS